MEFHIVGSQWDRKHGRLRPVICKVTNKRTGSTTFEKLVTPLTWAIETGYMDLVAGTATMEARSYMKQKFAADGGLISPEHCIDVMTAAIRQVSRSVPAIVGPDCMAVHIQAATPKVTVTYMPEGQHRIADLKGDAVIGPIAFTPYVVAPNMVARPSISTNNMFMATPDVDIRFDGGPQLPIDLLPATQFDQPRTPQP